MFSVYVLTTDDRRGVRYVGCTSRPLRARLQSHRCAARSGSTVPVSRWVATLLEYGRRPRIESILKTESPAVAVAVEAAWIALYRAMGFELLNRRANCYIPTPEHRAAIAAARRRSRPARVARGTAK